MNGSATPLRIAIATLGRFHVLDLARELDALGHEVHFYSYVPKRRAAEFGLPGRCHVALFPFLAPLIVLQRLLRRTRFAMPLELVMYRAADFLVARRLRPCDVFIGMSGIYVRAPAAARSKFGAKVVIERGSMHIDAQREILERTRQMNPGAATVPIHAVRREHADYVLAERIAIPSRHAEASFLERGITAERLFRNPYGVDLAMFTPDPAVPRDPHLVLFVGAWSYQKGADVLAAAMSSLATDDFRLRHVGAAGDAPLPQASWFESAGSVDQREIPAWYRRARCLVLPSRQDGFGMVLVQALACGCPIVGTTMTGAVDLKEMLPTGDMVQVVPVGDATALAAAVRRCPDRATCTKEWYAAFRTELGWNAYARRYESLLRQLVAQPSVGVTVPTPTAATASRAPSRVGGA